LALNDNIHDAMNSLIIRGYCLQLICFHSQLACGASITLGNDDVYTRYDRDAYLAARHGTKTTGQNAAVDKEDPSSYIKDRRRKTNDSRNDKTQHPYDDPNKCTTYLAQSSIPNSGLGMYTTIHYQKGEHFPFPEIGILLQEKQRHYSFSYGKKEEKELLINQYPWSAQILTLGAHEVGHGETIVPGLGMLANSHLGLVNMRHRESWKTQSWRDGTDTLHRTDSLTLDDMGRGAYSAHGRVVFEATKLVEPGEELFVSYGDEWFTNREELLGIIPGESQFTDADALLRSFSRDNIDNNSNNNLAHRSDANERYEKLLNEAHEKDKRLRMALPNNVQDVPEALQMGTARFSAKDSLRSTEWLEENGACLDNIVTGVTTIPQAGRGAFTTPVVTLDRQELHLWEKVKKRGRYGLVGEQLLLNYCYGHKSSSLLFFPYAPSVNFINHGSLEESNAEIRWSGFPYHKAEWLDVTIDEMKAKLKTGLLFDIVATRDIRRGEEILFYYGKEWEDEWDEHVKEWGSMKEEVEDVNDYQPIVNLTERLGIPTTNDLNQLERNSIIRTKDEQATDPYPPHITTLCRFKIPKDCISFTHIHPAHSTELHCQSRWRVTYDEKDLFPCTVLSRENIEGMDWYSAQVVEAPKKRKEDSTYHLVEYMTRDAIMFVDRPYSKDQYARGVFRQAIGLPDGIMPSHWLDLDGDEDETGEDNASIEPVEDNETADN